jgi:diguanylate cyclase (GGDEF)-like protein/PAS domain S-box-containing protein
VHIPYSKYISVYFLSFLLSVGAISKAHSNVLDFSFEHYSVADGLSQNTVTDIVEDKNGFIWFSTTDGLNRFDGYEFKQYNHDSNDPTSLPAPFVSHLLLDSTGNLWVGTRNGLGRYNTEKDNFSVHNKDNSEFKDNVIRALGLNINGQILVADSTNIYQYNNSTESFLPLKSQGATLPADIRSIMSDEDKTWIGSKDSGVYILDHKSNILYSLKEANPWNIKIEARNINDLKRYGEHYWLGTDTGAFSIHSATGATTHYTTNSNIPIVSNLVETVERDTQGKIWLGTDEGISIISKKENSVFSIDNDNASKVGLNSRYIFKIFRDSKDSIWLGTFADGIYKYNQIAAQIKHFSRTKNNKDNLSNDIIWAFAEDNENNIWIATQSGGINLFALETAKFKHYLQDLNVSIWDLKIDENSRMWIATSAGLYIYQIENDESLSLLSIVLAGVNIDKISYLGNKIWLKSYDNFLRSVDPITFKVKSQELANKNIESVTPSYLDSQQNLWLFTDSGLILYNLNSKQFNQLILNIEENIINLSSVLETSSAFWLSSANHGILKLDKKTYKIVDHLSKENILPGNEILMSLAYEESIWLSIMGTGITQISTKDGGVISQISPEKLDYNDLNEGAALLTRNNKILFGGAKGFHIFNPSKVQGTKQLDPILDEKVLRQQQPTITELRLFNRPVSLHSSASPLNKPINLVSTITLPNNTSVFSLTFAQLNPVDPSSVSYRYKLGGLSDEWLDADPRTRQATFSNLDFGSYDFMVQNRDGLGSWSPTTKLNIQIEPPIWLHRNALLLYGAILILLLLLLLKHNRTKNATRLVITENEERLKLTLWSSGDELWDWDIYQGQVFRANTWGTVDFPQDDIRVNSAYESNIHPNDIVRIQKSLREHLEENTEYYEVTYRARNYKGEWLWLLDRGKVVLRDDNHQPQRMTGTLKNISHLKLAEEQLKLFKRSIETISDGVFITDTNFRFISVNHSYCKYTGETREQALASYLTFHQYPGAFTEEVKKALRQKGNWFGEVESRRSDGEKYEMELNVDAITDEDGKISHYVGVFSDITSRKGTEKELLKLANTDPLTDLPNRSFFQASHANIVRRNTHHALICLDMDNFKKINDSLGHQTGDILIKQIAKRLQKIAGTTATCYRLGGDEFSILIDNSTDIHHITHLCQTVLDNMARPFLINKQEFVLGASVGIAFYPEDGSTHQELLKNADTAMYFAKNAGGNKYQFFSGEMNQNAVRQLQIENLIRHGLKEDLFTVFYQPKVDIATGKLTSMEALVRYEHPEKGIVSPAQFIPLAEETGQIVEIGEVVLQKACEDTKRWVDAGLFSGRVAVNISARQFEIPDLDEKIAHILQKVGLSPLHLECEITEGTLMQNPENALRMMENLRERGIHLALDDFGTGYSSLAYLKRFPLNTLKIDKAFIDDIATSSVDRHMTAAIITIAHNLGLKVVAEGVEHENQLSILRRYGCEMLQGYLYSKPLSSMRFERLLKENFELNKIIRKTDA